MIEKKIEAAPAADRDGMFRGILFKKRLLETIVSMFGEWPVPESAD